MKRRLACLLAVVLVGAFIFVAFFAYQNRNQTTVSGYIISDTTWSGTINFTDAVTVNKGVTLTIQPGTTVNFNRFPLQVDGTLVARGNENQTILFNDGVTIDFSASSTPWNEKNSSGCIVDRVISEVQYAVNGGSPKISNNIVNPYYLGGCLIWIERGAPIIVNNNITGRSLGAFRYPGGDAAISILRDSNATIMGNTIQTKHIGIGINDMFDANGTVTIRNNLIRNTETGVCITSSSQRVVFEGNTITQSKCSLGITHFNTQSVFSNNNIYGNNNTVSVSQFCPSSIDLSNNWWGTTDVEAIRSSITDSYTNSQLATVVVEPVLKAQNPNAPKP